MFVYFVDWHKIVFILMQPELKCIYALAEPVYLEN